MLQCLLRTISHRYLVRAKYTRINSGRAKAIARPLIIGDIHLNAAASDQTVRLQHTRSKFLQAFLAQPPIPSSRYKPAVSMASDEVYSDFLDKANQDTGTSKTSTQSTSKLSTKAVDTDIPGPLQKVEQYYTSEADEPFEPVSLKWNGSNMPSESMLWLAFFVQAIVNHLHGVQKTPSGWSCRNAC